MSDERTEYIGPYRILEVLGEGGMGVVYRAEQLEPVRREIALKVLRAESNSAEVLARFAAERQALAVMDHPSIAKVFDAGVAEDGRSFFAMELVTGTTLLEYCDQCRLSVRARIRLFVSICGAVQHAHQKGLIHRDLKPSNILVSEVDGRPMPRIIDFGIAKASEGASFDGTALTRSDQVIGTPAYMSPEQLEGSNDVDTRADIYALGIVLYELVVGALPFDGAAYRGWAAVAATLHRDPPRPSTRFGELGARQDSVARDRSTNPGQLVRDLDGDLGWILSQAMEKDRDERYETANAMALDLERLLTHEAVHARGASKAYVMRKFVRRNRLPVAFGVTVSVGLIVFSAVTVIQARSIATARDEALSRRVQAEGLIDFMLSDLRAKLEPIGRLEILDDVGAQATAYFRSIPEDQFSDDELASRAQALYQIGMVRFEQGNSQAASDAFAESLRLASALSDRTPGDVDLLFGLAQSHFYVGYAAWMAGDLEVAEEQFLGYLDVAEELVTLEPSKLDYQVELGYAHSNLGSVREARGDLAGAAESFGRTLEVERVMNEADPMNIDHMGELAETHNKLGAVMRKQGDYAGALDQHTRELELKQAVLKLVPTHAYWRFRTAVAMAYLGDIAHSTGDLEQALDLYLAHDEVVDSLLSMDPVNTTWQQSKAAVLRRTGVVETRLGRIEAAERRLDQAERLMTRLVETDSAAFGWRTDLAHVYVALSELEWAEGRRGAALSEADRALRLFTGGGGATAEHAEVVAKAHILKGRILQDEGVSEEARRDWARALEAIAPFATGADQFQFRPYRAEALLLLGRSEEAREDLRALAEAGHVDRRLQGLARADSGA